MSQETPKIGLPNRRRMKKVGQILLQSKKELSEKLGNRSIGCGAPGEESGGDGHRKPAKKAIRRRPGHLWKRGKREGEKAPWKISSRRSKCKVKRKRAQGEGVGVEFGKRGGKAKLMIQHDESQGNRTKEEHSVKAETLHVSEGKSLSETGSM